MQEHPLKKTFHHLAEEAIPPETDLWPKIQSNLKKRKYSRIVHRMILVKTNSSHRNKWQAAVIILLGFLIIAFILLATPQGQSIFQKVLAFLDKLFSTQ